MTGDICYFCVMFLKKRRTLTLGSTLTLVLLLINSCGSFLKDTDENGPIARVGEDYLYKDDIAPLLYEGITKGDSATIVTNFINTWASKQLMLSKAKINLPEDKLSEFDALVSDYQTDLYTRAYKEALVQQAADSTVTASQMKRFYDKEKENFRLQERIVKIRFIQLPKRFLNKDEVIKRLKSFRKKDVAYLDSIGKYLKKSQFFELEDALGVYLAKVTGVLQVNDVAPLSFIEPAIKQVLINRRKLDYIRRLETEVIDEAIKENEFEIYGKED